MTTFLILLALYFLPTLLALPGRRAGVFLFNVCLAWTGIGWMLMVLMAIYARLCPVAKGSS